MKTMLANSMTLASQQRGVNIIRCPEGGIVPDTVGQTALCENLRERISGRLEAVSHPALTASTEGRFVAADRRGNVTYIFSLSEFSELVVAGYMDVDGTFTKLDKVLATLPSGEIKGSASAGEFFVLSLTDGSLFYLLWNPDECSYTVLGTMPELPQFEVYATDIVSLTLPVEGVTFKEAVADFRSGVPDSVTEQVGNKLLDAWESAETTAHRSQRWMQPVAVRFALRLWDGRILRVSAPKTVALPDTGYQGFERILLPLAGNSTDGFTGTSSTAITADCYRIAIEVGDWQTGAWESVIRGVEVWITSPQSVVNSAVLPSLSQYVSDSAYYLSVFLPANPIADLSQGLMRSRPYIHSVLSPGALTSGVVKIDYSASAEKNRVDYSLLSAVGTRSALKANILLGHGDFLHIGDVIDSYPQPCVASWHFGKEEEADTIVSVSFRGVHSGLSVSARVTLRSSELPAVLSYPSADADKMRIVMKVGESVYAGEFQLTADPFGGDFSTYTSPTMQPITLAAADSSEFQMSENEGITDRKSSTLITMRRGNPFVEVSRTEGVGGEIFAMSAQTSRGGAYTRQFVYLMTDDGISALTHKSDGSHADCRVVSGEIVSNRECLCATSSGVYVMTDSGALLRISDAKCTEIIGGMSGCRRMAWDSRRNELWLVSDSSAAGWQRSVVVQISKDFRAFLSTLTPQRLLQRAGNPLMIVADETSGEMLYSLSVDSDELLLPQKWISTAEPTELEGLCMAAFGVYGSDVDATVRMDICSSPAVNAEDAAMWGDAPVNHRCHPLLTLSLKGEIATPVEQPVVIPTYAGIGLSLKKRLRRAVNVRCGFSGRISELTATSLVKL